MRRLLTIYLVLFSLLSVYGDDEIMAFRITKANGLPDNEIREIYQDSTGYMYFCTTYATYQYDGYNYRAVHDSVKTKLKEYNRVKNKSDSKKSSDNLGNSFHLTSDGYLEYTDARDGETIRFLVADANLRRQSDNLKIKVVTDYDRRIWVSVNGNGIFIYNRDSKQITHLTSDERQPQITTNYIVYMTIDRDGRIWAAGQHHGLICLQAIRQQYDILSLSNLEDNERGRRLVVLTKLSDGSIFVAGGNGKAYRADANLQNLHPIDNDRQKIISVCLDNKQRLWLGSRLKGVCIDGHWYGSGRVDDIVNDLQGRIWICCSKRGVIQVQQTEYGHYEEKSVIHQMKENHPFMMKLDQRGRILIGSDKGLFRFSPDSILTDSTAYAHLADGIVRCIYEDSQHRLWIGTRGQGLLRSDDDGTTFRRYTTTDGLPSNVILSIGEDSKGRLCFGTEDGLVVMKVRDKDTVGLSVLYINNVPARNVYSEECIVKLEDGRMAMGTADGIVILSADYQSPKEALRNPVVTDFIINGTSVYDMPDILTGGHISHTKSLELNHDQNSLSIYFSDFTHLEKNTTLYSYWLEGYDRDWSEPLLLNMTTYKNLRPGRYVFHLRCRKPGGEWLNAQETLEIRILPPWWLTWWALILYTVVAVIIAVIVIRQLRHAARLRQHIAVEKELTEYKLQFFTNISHEFRTPLTLIHGSMDRIRQQGVPSTLNQPISTMQRNVDRLLRLINQLLEFRRMQRNKLSLALEETDIVAFVYNICQMFHDISEQKSISLAFLPNVKSYTMFVDRGFIDKAVYNLLSNAFKYTPQGGSVIVRLKQDGAYMSIVVEDSGVGVPKDKQNVIFDRYARGQLRSDSLGIGLDLTAELIRTHHGSITYTDREGGGSNFTIKLPVDNTIYQPDDFVKTDTSLGTSKAVIRQGYTEPVSEIVQEPMNDHNVLVVEDDAELQSYLRQTLGNYFQITTASDGEEACAILKDSHFDLIISDVMMPKMNGFQLLAFIRKHSRLRMTPFILLTALTSEDKHLKGLETGADAYITKPFSLSLLILQCRNLLQRKRETESNTNNGTERQDRMSVPKIVLEERDSMLLDRLYAWVNSHLASPELSVDLFAEEMGYGRTKFYTKLKELTGKTPNDYIKECRLQRAAELLTDEHITVSEVAYQVGMASSQYLSTVFKKRFGITPSQYQKGHQPLQ